MNYQEREGSKGFRLGIIISQVVKLVLKENCWFTHKSLSLMKRNEFMCSV